MEYPEDLMYCESGLWIKEGEETIKIGITDYSQTDLGKIIHVELPEVGRKLKKGEEIGLVESEMGILELISPATGEVEEVNESLNDEPTKINSSPYEEGWLIEICLDEPDELDNLMIASEYEVLVLQQSKEPIKRCEGSTCSLDFL